MGKSSSTNDGQDDMEVFEEIGFKVRLPKELSDPDGTINVMPLGDDVDEGVPIYGAYVYQYVSDAVKEDTNKILNDKSLEEQVVMDKLEHEIYPRVKNLFTIAAFRTNLIKDDEHMKALLETNDVRVLKKTDKYIQVLAFSEGLDMENLTEEEQKQYKDLLNITMGIANKTELTEIKPMEPVLYN